MITYHYESKFRLREEQKYTDWILALLKARKAEECTLDFIFCTDEYLLKINQEYLHHDYYTDIITFPREEGEVSGDIFISIERVRENAEKYKATFENELLRVMSHGILHLLGFNDNTLTAQKTMRQEESRCIDMFHVKHT